VEVLEGNEVSSINLSPSHPPVCDYNFPRLNYIRTQEPVESSQESRQYAFNFVPFNNVDLSLGVDNRKTEGEIASCPKFGKEMNQ
jgi:hypothetical protein